MTARLLGLLAAAALAAAPSPADRARSIETLLEKQGMIQDGALVWEERRYRLRGKGLPGSYEICSFYEGICYRAQEEGFDKPLAVAVSESGGTLSVLVIDWPQYEKDRASAAKQYFLGQKVAEKDLTALVDEKGQALFDGWGRLTPAGTAAFQRALSGKGGWQVASGAAPASAELKPRKRVETAKARKADLGKDAVCKAPIQKGIPIVRGDSTRVAKAVKALELAGFAEISGDERCCIHTVPFTDYEMNLRVIVDRGKERYFVPKTDPALAVAAKVREDGVCRPRGSNFFKR